VTRERSDVDQAACGDALSWWRPLTVLSVPSDLHLAAQRRVFCAALDAHPTHDGAALAPRCTVSTDRRTCAAVLRAVRAPRGRCALLFDVGDSGATVDVARRAVQHRAPACS
jgi:hypothetical protein